MGVPLTGKMIRYDYKCNHCLWIWETIRTMDDDSKEQCPKCDSLRTGKIVTECNFILKGTGFHDTDYGKYGPK